MLNQTVLLKFQNDPYHFVAPRVISLWSSNMSFLTLLEYTNFATVGASMSPGHISSFNTDKCLGVKVSFS